MEHKSRGKIPWESGLHKAGLKGIEMWNTKDIVKMAKDDYKKTWQESKDFVPERKSPEGFQFSKKNRGKVLVNESLNDIEHYLITRGFEETNNKTLLKQKDLEKIYGIKTDKELGKHFSEGNLVFLKSLKEGWFETLFIFQDRKPMPIELYTVDKIFLKDKLKEHFEFSLSIMDEKISFEEGVNFIDKMFTDLNFPRHYFVRKKPQDIMLTKDMQEEIIMDYKQMQFKIGEVGMVSPISLSMFGIEHPVFVANFDLGKISMIKQGLQNEQAATFPQLFNKLKFDDEEIRDLIHLKKEPKEALGESVIMSIEKCCENNGNKFGPIRYKAYDRIVNGKHLQIYMIQPEKRKLIGKDAFNEIYVYDGQVYSLPKISLDQKSNEILTKGKDTGINFVKAFANYIAWKIENMRDKYEVIELIKAEDYSTINVEIPTEIKKFVASKGNQVELDADLNLRAELKFS